MQNWHLLLTGLAGTWVFVTLAIATAAYWMWDTRSIASAIADEGPLQWVYNFSMEGGTGRWKRRLPSFPWSDTSKKPIELKGAELISLIDGTQLKLEVVAVDDQGNSSIVPLDRVQLIPPGAPIEMVAKFGPPDPTNPAHVLGLEPKAFLERSWSLDSMRLTTPGPTRWSLTRRR